VEVMEYRAKSIDGKVSQPIFKGLGNIWDNDGMTLDKQVSSYLSSGCRRISRESILSVS
jgi:hypothetical protein